MCRYEETRACHNTLLVFCGREEPGSAPVTQLLMALVIWTDPLDLSADSLTLPLLIYSALWNVLGEAFLSHQQPRSPNLISSFVYIYIVLRTPNTILWGVALQCVSFSWPASLCSFEPTLREFCIRGGMHSFASLATDVGEIFFFLLLWAEPFGVSKNGLVWTVGQLFSQWRLK